MNRFFKPDSGCEDRTGLGKCVSSFENAFNSAERPKHPKEILREKIETEGFDAVVIDMKKQGYRPKLVLLKIIGGVGPGWYDERFFVKVPELIRSMKRTRYKPKNIAESLFYLDWQHTYIPGEGREEAVVGIYPEHPEIREVLKEIGLKDEQYERIVYTKKYFLCSEELGEKR